MFRLFHAKLLGRASRRVHRLYTRYGRRRRWWIGAIAIAATATVAAIQHESLNSSVEQTLLMSVPKEIIQVPNVATGMRSLTAVPTDTVAGQGDDETVEKPVFRWQRLVIRRGDNLASLLRSRNLYSPEIHRTLTTNVAAYSLNDLLPGKRLRLGIDTDGLLKQLAYETDDDGMLVMLRKADGSYSAHHQKRRYTTRYVYLSSEIHESLFSAGKRAGMSDRLIMELANVFAWDIDFALDLRRGDRFSAIYREKYWRGEKIDEGHIIAAEFINRGQRYRAIALADDNGRLRYYTPSGNSVQRQFLKTPVQFSRISSRYTRGRYHPILKRWRAHRGVDYVARTGTPVRATAAGRILIRSRNGGYGKTVMIKHGGRYSTLYAHLSRYQAGQRVGSLVRQGEVIGYVGKSGLATGSHLHYEFRVNGRHRNPLTVKLPRSQSIGDKYRERFMRVAQQWSAELDRIGGQVRFARNQEL